MSIFNLLAEGFESALLPCSLILLVPGAAVGLTARAAAIPAISGFFVGTLALSWIRFGGRGGDFHPAVAAALLLLAAVLLLVPLIDRLDLVAVASGLLAGAGSAELWKPCVGEWFGSLLDELPDRGMSGLALLTVFLIGTLSPLVVMAAAHHLTPDWILDRIEPYWAILGGAVLTVLAVATVAGLHDDVVGKLFEWSVDDGRGAAPTG